MVGTPVDEPSDYEIADAMYQLGGTFVNRLAAVWMVADPDNRERLKAAFADYWDDFRQAVILRRREKLHVVKGSE